MKKIFFLSVVAIIFPLFIFADQPKPTYFRVTSDGEIFGLLEDGTPFRQVNIEADFRLQKFSWSGGSWYISSVGIIEADDDDEAIYTHRKRVEDMSFDKQTSL